MGLEQENEISNGKNHDNKDQEACIDLLDPSQKEEVLDEPGLQAPDGGWGWVVVFGTFLVHVLCDGMAYSFGVYVECLTDHFNASYSEVGFLGSLLLGVTWGSGPISSVLVNKFGCRWVAIGGTVVAAVGFITSAFAPSIYFMYVSFGIVAGLGLGMIYLPAIVAVSFYFEKRRSLATGLAVCGSGVGTFLFAPLTQALVDEYGWQGSLLIETGLLLHCFICGAIFRPLSVPESIDNDIANMSDVESKANVSEGRSYAGSTFRLGQLPPGARSALGASCSSLAFARSPQLLSPEMRLSRTKLSTSRISVNRPARPPPPASSKLQIPQIFIDNSECELDRAQPVEVCSTNGKDLVASASESKIASPMFEANGVTAASSEPKISTQTVTQTDLQTGAGSNYGVNEQTGVLSTSGLSSQIAASSALTVNTQTGGMSTLGVSSDTGISMKNLSDTKRSQSSRSVNMGSRIMSTRSITSSASRRSINPMDRKDIFYRGSLANIPMYKANPDHYRKSVLSIPLESVSIKKEDTEECCLFASLGISSDSLRKLMDCGLLCDICFLLFAISNLLTSIGLGVPYIFLQDRATSQLGVSRSQGSFLISIIGIANMIGRVVFGFLADFKWVNRLVLYNSVLVVCGVFSALTIFCNTYVLLAAYAALFGLLMGIYICMTPIVIVDLLGLDKLSNAFGLVLLFQGIGGVAGPPLAGAVYDSTKDYNNSFYVMGACVFISGAMLFPIFAIQRCSKEEITPEDAAMGKKSSGKSSRKTSRGRGETKA